MTTICYTCLGNFYYKELVCSALTVKANCPSSQIKVMCDNPVQLGVFQEITGLPLFDEIVPLKQRDYEKIPKDKRFLSKILFSTFDVLEGCEGNVIFLDTDTLVLDDITQVFHNDSFEIAGSNPPVRREDFHLKDFRENNYKERDLNRRINTGVYFIRDHFLNKFTLNMQESCEKNYMLVNKEKQTIMDQHLVETYLQKHLEVDLLILPNNYNLRMNSKSRVTGYVYVVHSHQEYINPELKKVEMTDVPQFLRVCKEIYLRALQVNSRTEQRVYFPIQGRGHIDEYWYGDYGVSLVPLRTLSTK